MRSTGRFSSSGSDYPLASIPHIFRVWLLYVLLHLCSCSATYCGALHPDSQPLYSPMYLENSYFSFDTWAKYWNGTFSTWLPLALLIHGTACHSLYGDSTQPVWTAFAVHVNTVYTTVNTHHSAFTSLLLLECKPQEGTCLIFFVTSAIDKDIFYGSHVMNYWEYKWVKRNFF